MADNLVDTPPHPVPDRRIVQVTTCANTRYDVVHTALCDDGTAWVRYGAGGWQRLPSIPGDAT